MIYGKFKTGQTVQNVHNKEQGILIEINTDNFMPRFVVKYQYDNIKTENYGDIQ